MLVVLCLSCMLAVLFRFGSQDKTTKHSKANKQAKLTSKQTTQTKQTTVANTRKQIQQR